MYIIQEILVSDEVLEKKFCCDVSKCKGACCYRGDYGAPLLSKEIQILAQELDSILPYLPERSQSLIRENGLSKWYKEMSDYGTHIHDDGACVFMIKDEGIAKCGIEKAYEDGLTDFQKPISCHLYPIRIKRNKKQGFEAINYDEWEICDAAREKGANENIMMVDFLRDSLTRLYGEEFFDEMKAAVLERGSSNNKTKS